jgi:hypothetical protein
MRSWSSGSGSLHERGYGIGDCSYVGRMMGYMYYCMLPDKEYAMKYISLLYKS